MGRILVVTTSTPEYQKAGYRTGLWLSELTHFVDEVRGAGHDVDIVSIAGGDVPLDPESLKMTMMAMGGTAKRYKDRGYMDQLKGTRSISEVSADDYDAIYLTGGHGTMFDFPDGLAQIVGDFAQQDKVVSAVCHGPSGLLNAQVDGRPLLQGRKVTGYSWVEEVMVRRDRVVPFKLQQALADKGAEYTKSPVPMGVHVVVDGKLVTGQNPMCAKGVAQEVIKLLGEQA